MTLTELPALSLFCILDVCSDTEPVGARPFDRTSIWFPVPATVKTLPNTPAPEVRPYVKPANSVEVGPCFDPDNVDVDQLFNSLLPRREISPVFDVSLNVDRLLLPKNQRVTIRGRLRAVFTVLRARYDLTPKLVEISSVTSTPVSVYRLKAKLTGLGTSFVLSTTEAYFRKQSPILGLPASYHLNFPATALVYGESSARTLSAESGEFTLNPSTRILLLSHFDTTFDEVTGNTPGYNWFNSLPPVISSNGVFNSPGCLEFNDFLQYLYTYLTPTLFPEEIPTWTAECWVYVPLGEFSMVPMCFSADGHPDNTAFYVGIETGNLGAIEVYVGVKNTNQNFTGIFRAIVPYDFTESWTHLVWQATSDGYQLYFGGQLLSDRDTTSTIIPFVLPEYSIYNPINVRSGFVLGTSLWYVGDDYYFTYPGKIDEVRLTESTLYYGVSFIPPTAPFTAEPIEPANAQLTLGKVMVLDSGVFTCQGQDAVFTKPSKVFKGLAASYTLTGWDITPKLLDRVLVASPRSFSVTGNQTIDIPTYVGVTGSVVGTVEASLPWPSGHRAGDLGIIITESSRANPGSRPITPPYGWSMLPGWPNFDPGSYCTVFYKIARSGSEPDAVFPVFTDHMILQMSVFRGVDAAQPFVTAASGANSSVTTAIQYPAVSGVIPRTRIVEFTTNPRDSASIDGATNRQNTSAAWVDDGVINNRNTATGDGGGISTYHATTRSQLNNGLPGTTASSLNGWASTRTTGTLVLRPIGWAPVTVTILSAEVGAFALTGKTATLQGSRVGTLLGEPGAFAVAGQDVGLATTRIVPTDSGVYTLTGQDASIGRPPVVLAGAAGVFTLAGQIAFFALTYALLGEAASYNLSGQDVTFSTGIGNIDGGDSTSSFADSYEGGSASTVNVNFIDGGGA